MSRAFIKRLRESGRITQLLLFEILLHSPVALLLLLILPAQHLLILLGDLHPEDIRQHHRRHTGHQRG